MNNLAEKIIESAAAKNLKIATAESCTGGLIADAFVSVSGSSNVFLGSVVCNTSFTKSKLLGIPAKEIEGEKVYSLKTAGLMAEKVLKKFNADIAVATTGIAGPTGCSIKNPVGTIYIAVAGKQSKTQTKKYHFGGTRNQIRKKASQKALELIQDSL